MQSLGGLHAYNIFHPKAFAEVRHTFGGEAIPQSEDHHRKKPSCALPLHMVVEIPVYFNTYLGPNMRALITYISVDKPMNQEAPDSNLSSSMNLLSDL